MARTNLIAHVKHPRGLDVVVDEFAAVILDLVSDAVLTRAIHHTEVLLPLGPLTRQAGRDIVEAAVEAAGLAVDDISWREEADTPA
ncbi:MAG TPA: hypothetical protein VMN58_06850 [Acidimicrobiales bacterium]|nr:hypothetical protein [Acidimicrobiales bacterium]